MDRARNAGGSDGADVAAETFSGTMVADYVSVGFGGGKVFPVFATAQAKAGSLFHEAIYTTASGLKASTPETELMSADGDRPVRMRTPITGRWNIWTRSTRFRDQGNARRNAIRLRLELRRAAGVS